MANQKIHEYLIERSNLGDDDFLDIDYFDGVNYNTAKIKGETLKATATGRLFTQTATSTPVTNTTTETTILDGGLGSLSVPADGFSVGDTFVFNMQGNLTSLNNQDLTIRAKSGSITFFSVTLNLPNVTFLPFNLNLIFVIRQIGAAGVADIATGGRFTYNKDASNAYEGLSANDENNSTFDTTISNTLDITAQWANADPGNAIESIISVLNKVY